MDGVICWKKYREAVELENVEDQINQTQLRIFFPSFSALSPPLSHTEQWRVKWKKAPGKNPTFTSPNSAFSTAHVS